jgi:hypothetical protein
MTWWRTSRRVRGCARTVRGVPQEKSLRGGYHFEREQEKGERDELASVEEGKERLNRFHPAAWDPPARDTGRQSVKPPRTVREARGRSGPQARTVR